jgi:tetratricopeptide (TPR) repeat protein
MAQPHTATGHAAFRATWWALSLVALVCAAYANSLAGPFVFDDQLAILDNPTLRSLSWTALVPPSGGGLTVEGRPVLNYSLALNHAISGYEVWSYHVVNLVIHAAAALVLFGVIRRTLHRIEVCAAHAAPLAFASAALWALHPLQTESVTYVVQRTESLMGLFYLLTLYCTLRGCAATRSGGWFASAVAACWLGMATKEVMVSAPLLVLLYDRTFIAGSFAAAWQRRQKLYVGLAASWLLLGFLVFASGNRGGTIGAAAGVTSWEYALCQSRALVRYLGLSAWPTPLIFDYGADFVKWFEVIPHAALDLSLLALTFVALWRWPALGFVGLWFFAILAPTSSVVGGTRQMLAEHRMYLSLAAVSVLSVVGLYRWLGRRSWLVWAAAAVAFGLSTAARNRDYRNELAIYADTVAKRPANPFARNNYGTALVVAGRIDAAAEQFAAAIRLLPDFAQGHNNLAGAYFRLGRPQDCVTQAAIAVRLQPDYAEAHANLGTAQLRLGNPTAAVAHFGTALRLKPDFADAHANLGAALAQAGRGDEAIARFETTLRLKPNHQDAHYSLGVVLQQAGRLAEAIRHYEAALRVRANYAEAHSNFSLALLQTRRAPEALAHAEAAVQLKPDFADARCNLALVLVELRRLPDAIREFETALRLNAHLVDARFRLGNALCDAGRPADAIPHYTLVAQARPRDPEVHNNLGSALFQGTERIDEAVALFRTAVQLRPDYAAAHCNLGVALVYQRKNLEARPHFEETLRLDPNNTEAAKHLARLQSRR